ncbi:hypothetical protein ISN45_At05g022490 [Arabidopsis thaliana x Arabidopsis arenosa]|uniref:Uncharacterized protein n=2 Tax=Arabidopsis TaxID=3701 RepID=A0A8T2DIK9_ARASU|nr:hypothetical protein ISN45_At05g022490 [Arabidopsis thaliana x Arabidopsis arenosa]KAG7610210.1 hypothetical protein ISN44_As05g022350 [Arabidopsis suecica]
MVSSEDSSNRSALWFKLTYLDTALLHQDLR